jgi:signal transduction histidine kinase/ActR/RegA family two-component response regulator
MDAESPLPFVAADLLAALVTATGDQLDANHEWREVFGSGGLWGRLPDEDARFAREYATEAARGAPVTHQVFLVDRPGADAPTPVLLHFLPVRLPDARSGRFPVSVTGEILREPASWAAEQTRRRRMEMLGRMSMGMAHDFNNLLTAVLGHAELLRSDLAALGAGSVPGGHLGALEQAANDGAALVRKIQQYIRNEKKEHVEPVELHAIADEVITLTRPYWHNEPRRRGIAIDLEPDLRPVPPILGAPTELREVLVNLVLNAVQAMPAGGTLAIQTRRREGRAAVVEVADTGVGMSETVRRRIFEPLFTTKGSGGSGMGLTMSQGIVQEHNGHIEVESEPGRGTAFRLVFPYEDGVAVAPAVAAAAPDENGSAAGLRLLVVEDEPIVRTVTTKLLRLRGHDVTDVDSGPAALDVLGAADAPFDLVVTDLSMPEMSGRELAATVRVRYPGLPVVLLTGDTDAVRDGADVAAVVKKPFQLDALDAVLRQVVEEAAAGPPVAEPPPAS